VTRKTGRKAEQKPRTKPVMAPSSPVEPRSVPGQGAGSPLVPQKHGGAIYQGTPSNIVPGPGRPRDELRAWLRTVTWERLPGIFAKWDNLDHEQQVGLMERIALKYGLGTQNESIAPEDVRARVKRMVEIIERGWPFTDKEACIKAIEEAWL
jgi:hypothetical protein